MMKFCRTLVLCLAASAADGLCQTATLQGIVRDAETLEVIVGANVALVGTSLGTSTLATGFFSIGKIPSGAYILRATHVGYTKYEQPVNLRANDSLSLNIFLQPEHVKSEEVVITATRTIREIADVPVRVELIPEEEIEEKLLMTPSSVAMLLNESTGMRVQTTSPTSSATNLRIQGLSGRYTQVLTDGIPNFGGLSAGFGLTQLLPLNLRQVEVIKGAASTLYGPDAIAGVVNFLTKDPKQDPQFAALINTTTQKGFDASAFYAQQFSGFGVTLLASRNGQTLFDVDGDGFGDVAEFRRTTIAPKFLMSLSEDIRLRAAMGYLSEDRLGGAVNAPPSAAGTGAPYVEEISSRRIDMSAQLDWLVGRSNAIVFKAAAMRLKRDALYGGSPFNGTQEILYTEAQYALGGDPHSLLLGSAYSFEQFIDRTADLGYPRGYRFSVPAIFAQDEFTISESWSLLFSSRLDFHNEFRTFFTPRLALMYRPLPELTLRLGGGSGFKAPTLFVEEAEERGFRNVRPLQNASAERAASGSFDLNYRTIIGTVGASFNLVLYVSRLSDALLAEPDSLQNNVLFLRNASGATLARGGEFAAKLTYEELKLSVGYTYLFATQNDDGETYELELNPRHAVGVTLVWESEAFGTKTGLETFWTGEQWLEGNPFRDRSPEYWIVGVIAEKQFGNFFLFLNLENILDTRQTRFDPLFVGNLQAGTITTLPVYAPLEGRVVNGGIRFVL